VTVAANHPIHIVIEAVDPPFTEEHGVLFGPQRGRTVDEFVSASQTTEFAYRADAIDSPHGLDFRGNDVHGKRRDRFLYLSWGLPDVSEPFVMFARSKIMFADLPSDLLEQAIFTSATLRCTMPASTGRSDPAVGTLRPPAITWSLDP